MTKCPVEDCKEAGDMKRTLYGQDGTGGLVACSKKLDKTKVSWKQLGVTVLIVVAILGATYLKATWGTAGEISKVGKHCDENAKNIQTYSINQAVIKEKIANIDRTLIKMERQRKEDKKEILKAIQDIKK